MNTKTVVLNAKKMNFDGKLDFSILSSQVTVYDDTAPEELLERIQDADVIVTKEMPVSGDLIRQFPAAVSAASLRCRLASNRITVAAMAALRDSTRPSMGILMAPLARAVSSGERPWASFPIITAQGSR